MIRRADRGFTLIELLTVIAIIAILAGITFAALPRILERAKLRRLDGALLQMRTTLGQYSAEHQSYPPGYGFAIRQAGEDQVYGNENDPRTPNPIPYMSLLGIYGNEAYFDSFSEGYDGNRDGLIQPLEFTPLASIDPVTQIPVFNDLTGFDTDGIYRADLPPAQIVDPLDPGVDYDVTDNRPFYYLPINKDQFTRAARFWRSQAGATSYPDGTTAYIAATWDPTDPQLENLYDNEGRYLIPARYDAYVLVSVGPALSTFNIVPTTDLPNVPRNSLEYFNIQAMRGYFLATRDLNNDKLLDFHFAHRTTGGPEANGAQTYSFNGTTTRNWLPDGRAPQGYGPYIFTVE